jgi:DNA replication and repair protein RecF
LAASVQGFEQVLVTAAVLDDVPDALRAHTVHIRAGRVVESDSAVPRTEHGVEHDQAQNGQDHE